GERLEPFVEREHPPARRRLHHPLLLARLPDLPSDERAVRLFEREHAGERVPQRQALGVARVDAGHERVDGVVHPLVPQPPPDGSRSSPTCAAAENSGEARNAGGDVGKAAGRPPRTTNRCFAAGLASTSSASRPSSATRSSSSFVRAWIEFGPCSTRYGPS